MKKNIALLYGFSFFDQFMIVIALWVPYLTTQGISMRQFMELQAVFALVILAGEVPSGLLSDLWGRKKTLLLGSTLKVSWAPSWATGSTPGDYRLCCRRSASCSRSPSSACSCR